MTVLLASGPGGDGFGPQLTLTYNSGAGSGPFGVDWSLGLPPVTGKIDKGLSRYLYGDKPDVSILSGTDDLVPVLDHGRDYVQRRRTVHGVTYDIYPYRPHIESLFARY